MFCFAESVALYMFETVCVNLLRLHLRRYVYVRVGIHVCMHINELNVLMHVFIFYVYMYAFSCISLLNCVGMHTCIHICVRKYKCRSHFCLFVLFKCMLIVCAVVSFVCISSGRRVRHNHPFPV